MLIRRIVCRGFKTYRDMTIIDNIDEKTNCVVGLNGSGKSSIFQALVFALVPGVGGSVLHEGSGGKASFGYVEIELDNPMKGDVREFPVETPTVVLKRNIVNDQEFFVNSKSVSRGEYIAFLQTSGLLGSFSSKASAASKLPFYIVEQGRVASLVSDETRFNFLREAAGTEVYCERRDEALEVLSVAKTKEEELAVAWAELEEKCMHESVEVSEYTELVNEKVCVESELAKCELVELEKVGENLKKKSGEIENEILKNSSKMDKLFVEIDEKNIEIDQIDCDIVGLNYSEIERKCLFAEKEQRDNELKVVEDEQLVKNESNILENVCANIVEMEQKRVSIADSISVGKSELVVLKLKLAESLSERKSVEDEIYRINSKLNSSNCKENLEILLNSLLLKNSRIKSEIAEKDLEISKLVRELIPIAETKVRDSESKMCELLDSQREFDSRKSNIEQKISTKKSSIFKQKQREFEIKRNLEKTIRELANANSFVLKNTNGNTRHVAAGTEGVVGLFGDFLGIPSIYRTAIESVGKSRLFNVLIESDDLADSLSKKVFGKGKVVLVPLNRLPVVANNSWLEEALLGEGIEACLLSSVITVNEENSGRWAPQIRALINSSFSQTVLVENLHVGMVVARKFKVDTVTLEGDQISKDLIVRGGGSRGGGGFTLVKNWQYALDLKSKLATDKSELLKIQAEISQMETHVKQMETELIDCAQIGISNVQIHETTLLINSAKKGLKTLIERKDEIEQFELLNLTENDLKNNDIDIKKCQLELREIELDDQQVTPVGVKEELEKNLVNISALISEIEKKISSLQKTLVNETSELNHFIESRIVHLNELRVEKQRSISLLNRQISEISAGMGVNDLADARLEFESVKLQFDQLVAQKQSIQQNDIDRLELEKLTIDSEKWELDSKLKKTFQKFGQIEAEIASLKNSVVSADTGESLMMSVRELRVRLIAINKELNSSRFELVNKKSIEQVEKLKRERNLLSVRKCELDESKKSIWEFITKLNLQEEEILSKKFDQVCLKFANLLNRVGLVGLDLELDLQGKCVKIGGLADGLSGGQRTVVSLCFLFALGSGFYILDEVDAALDTNFRMGISRAILEESGQLFFTSFRPEFCQIANKHFLVSMNSGTSLVTRVSRETALAFVEMDTTKSSNTDESMALAHGA